MRFFPLLIIVLFSSCKKENNQVDCSPGKPILRHITNKKATVRLTATAVMPVYLVEEGTIDTQLHPCDFPMEYYQDGLKVTISGFTKQSDLNASTCCIERFTITSISK